MLPVIGLDFDNTMIRYDDGFHREALCRGLIPADTPVSKRAVRDAVRKGPGGEEAWQELQAELYGPGILGAEPSPGLARFLERCHRERVPVRVVSHKTRIAARGNGEDLHAAAETWLRAGGFLTPGGLTRGDVYFEPTREAKLGRIRALGLSLFVDDLEDVLAHPEFPEQVRGILFDPFNESAAPPGVVRARDFAEVERHVFGA